jgi:hypothetical protein
MKTILYYLNWALHDFNRACFYIIKKYLKFVLTLFVMFLISIPILFFTDNEWAIGIYGIFLFFGSLFVVITWMIKNEKSEAEEVGDQNKAEIKSWKQSAVSSGKWVLYTMFLLVAAAIIVSFL